jgi:superfamily II DNA/RNA helicase
MDSLPTRFRNEVFGPYLDLLKAQFRIHPTFSFVREVWDRELSMERLANGPFLERAQLYAPGDDLRTLGLHSDAVRAVEAKLGGRGLYKHQTDAIRLVLAGENVVVATGTSSGKTLCFQLPILHTLLGDAAPGLRAVIIYPLNALVNDQLDEWARLLAPYPKLTFAKFTGQTPSDQKDHEERLRESITKRIQTIEPGLSDDSPELQRRVERELRDKLDEEAQTPNHLRHRAAIRAEKPQVLITNFSMLEYLLVRPVDAPIFEGANLQFLVLDEAHAYRGVQATEIGYLLRRLKDRLGQPKPRCIATSATLGDRNDPTSLKKVRDFAEHLFDAPFGDHTPIYGTAATPELLEPSIALAPTEYIAAANVLRANPDSPTSEVASRLVPARANEPLGQLLSRDRNLHRVRSEILTAPRLARDVAKALWGDVPESEADAALHALLDLVAEAKREPGCEDMLPTRLHYFVKAQQGLHLCLRSDCPERARNGGRPAVFLSRKPDDDETPEGLCPHCSRAGFHSHLIEVVSCRKCGYLFGALQDLGPRFRQNPDITRDVQEERFDNFDTALGWAADSFWSFFSVEDDLPYPTQVRPEEDEEDPLDLLVNPARISFCLSCGKKVEAGHQHLCPGGGERELLIFHRQCPAHDHANLDRAAKRPLTCCPNCGARNNSGVELVRRFQESEDETGLAMALPLAYFPVGPRASRAILPNPKKLLTFTDHRQRAAAFPSLLEEETFTHDAGRKIVGLLRGRKEPWSIEELGRELACIADERRGHSAHDPQFFLPVSRLPDDIETTKPGEPANLSAWQAEVFAYFGVPDSARESAEDLGLAAMEYQIDEGTKRAFHELLPANLLTETDSYAALQTLLAFMRKARAFTLPTRVPTDAPAFGRVAADIYFAAGREGRTNTRGWLPRVKKDGTYNDNAITDYLARLTGLDAEATRELAKSTWGLLTTHLALKRHADDKWQLFHDQLRVCSARERYVCSRCGIVTTLAALRCCPRKACGGHLEPRSFNANTENAIACWVAGAGKWHFASLRSEEHTAQINKDLAKEIEEAFRGNGVNLLSSTTTFEMGINIGDLQKVLLRNAPPTPAAYVQRVGRAGRGADKNSVCVTLCRGTKYDLDMWREPARLMSGAMRAPTVFLENRIIAQRHFNAIAFAAFLRELAGTGRLPDRKQRIRLEGFLPPESRTQIPAAWRKVNPPSEYFDFPSWLSARNASDLFRATGNNMLLNVLGGLDAAKAAALDDERGYRSLTTAVGAELGDLLSERQQRFTAGAHTEEVDRSIQNLIGGGQEGDVIGVLARAGFLPRYAFPLDVVSLETRRSRWATDSDVELSRDRAIAISEFAPGAQVVARKKVFVSAGLYIASSEDKPERRWFAQCPTCAQIRTARKKEDLASKCQVCDQPIGDGHKRGFVEPHAFTIRFDGRRQHDTARFTKSTLIRQRQSLTHFIDSVPESQFTAASSLFRIALLARGQLFRYNLGPARKGFVLCPACGMSTPRQSAIARQHSPPRGWRSGGGFCNCTNLFGMGHTGIAYAHQFESYCLVIRPLLPVGSIESLSYAIHKGACHCLQLDTSDLGVSWRFLNQRTERTSGKEIVLYDRTPGGAGFVKEASQRWAEVEAAAREVCECTKNQCEHSCYDCLKDYGNQGYHEVLDRHAARGFLVGAPNAAGVLPILPTP